jgi:hypothetical protein
MGDENVRGDAVNEKAVRESERELCCQAVCLWCQRHAEDDPKVGPAYEDEWGDWKHNVALYGKRGLTNCNAINIRIARKGA